MNEMSMEENLAQVPKLQAVFSLPMHVFLDEE